MKKLLEIKRDVKHFSIERYVKCSSIEYLCPHCGNVMSKPFVVKHLDYEETKDLLEKYKLDNDVSRNHLLECGLYVAKCEHCHEICIV